jgi:NAD(P)-dependent dehydrogenase (short-subunit alcohol dehydrogenase family)
MPGYDRNRILQDQVAIVTGAASGIGRAIAVEFAGLGAAVALFDVDAAGLVETAGQCAAAGGTAHPLIVDCSDAAATTSAVTSAHAWRGRLDILVNNAGRIRLATFPGFTEDDYDAVMDLNARGSFFLMQAVAPHLPRGGRIINIGSIAGVHGRSISIPYAASKAALMTMTKTVALALAPRGITVNGVVPGLIDTPFNDPVDSILGVQAQGLAPGEFTRRRGEEVPLGRHGTPEDVAGVVSFLASPAASYVTGENIIVAGGWVID